MNKRLEVYLEDNCWDELLLLKNYATISGVQVPFTILINQGLWNNFEKWRESFIQIQSTKPYLQNGSLYYKFEKYDFFQDHETKQISLTGKEPMIIAYKQLEGLEENLFEHDGEYFLSPHIHTSLVQVLKDENLIIEEMNKYSVGYDSVLHVMIDENRLQELMAPYVENPKLTME